MKARKVRVVDRGKVDIVRIEKSIKKKTPFPLTGEYKFIPKGLWKFCVPIKEVSLLRGNPRINEIAAKKLTKYIKENGFRKPIVVDQNNIIRAGNTAYKAARLLGMLMIPVAQSEWIKEDEAMRYVLTDNKSNEWPEWDEDILLKLMQTGIIREDRPEDSGFTQRELFKIRNFAEIKKGFSDEIEYSVFSKELILEEAFKEFRKQGFPYPKRFIFECMQEINKLAQLNNAVCLRSILCYKIIDTFHPQRYGSYAKNQRSPIKSFNLDKSLKKSLFWEIDKRPNNLKYALISPLTIVSGTQVCNRWRPAFVKMLYNEYCPVDGTVLDPCMGYGAGMVGFLASHCRKYIGIEPSTEAYKGNSRIVKYLKPEHKNITLYKSTIEDLDIKHFNLKSKVDLIFTSPPYFQNEIYCQEDNQSFKKYPDYLQWKKYFLYEMILKCQAMLKTGGKFIINIENVKISGKVYPLVRDTKVIANKIGLQYEKTEFFELGSAKQVGLGKRLETNSDEIKIIDLAKESVLFFVKN